ncbi:hypothetical protein LTR10_006808 [Elasticomyces elasticus]|uniref:Major facilitator superfamily (MFS) profile domain-containing protein n=1 Tax=Elasticomyces elasticus TaxID=574655 RepID=A0AAN7WA08_9PEZI|nr:hypothetical protein LTR10_006808 [Elasticomyces elasticus]KAK4972790.1 hypothetical protein LTR42_006084 [Elasticomyces elasticus]KAK5700833.1 hypothetical protein LTR97_005350 [Elasticomyces elasticus]KAK5728904.1 hypothetical protein LTR15_002045 [Elasticomyces elasticus]
MATQQQYDLEPKDLENNSDKAPESLDQADEEKYERDQPNEAAAQAEAQPTGPAPGGPSPPPNGGSQAWLQVLGSWCLFFNTWGLLNTFGVYQTYYESGARFTASSSDISWIGSVQALSLLLIGTVAGPIFDRGHFRYLLVGGGFLVVFGHMMLSLSTTLWQAVLAQGFCVGIGAGALFVPAVAIMPTYFTTNLGLAIGIAASGSSMGGIIYPIMFYKLIPEVGFPWAVRILGFTVLATLMVPIFCMKMRVKPAKVRKLFDPSAFTDGPYIWCVITCTVGYIGLYVGIFYLSFFGQSTGLTGDSLSFYLVPILNAASVLGRTVPNWISDKIGPLNVITPGALLMGVILLCNLGVKSAGGLIATVFLFGLFSGIFIALPPVLFVQLTKNKAVVGTRIGMGFAIMGCGVLIGGPAAGAILQRTPNHQDWTGVWLLGGITPLAAAVSFVLLRGSVAGFKPMVKA